MAGNLFNHEYPYTDFHELNLDWVIKKNKEFNDRLDQMYSDAANQIMLHYLDKLLPECTYDAVHERLVLEASLIVGEGNHVYDPNTETMEITEEV